LHVKTIITKASVPREQDIVKDYKLEERKNLEVLKRYRRILKKTRMPMISY
jgi:hypothetical protein